MYRAVRNLWESVGVEMGLRAEYLESLHTPALWMYLRPLSRVRPQACPNLVHAVPSTKAA